MKQPLETGISTRRKVLIWGILIILFLMTMGITIVSYAYPGQEGIVGLFTRYHFEAMVGIAMGGVVIGASSYYLFADELRQKDKRLQTNMHLLLSFLNEGEKEFVQFLMEHNGQAFQSELAKLPGMSRLKAHRLVIKLKERKIVHIHEYGKTNIVMLNAALRTGNPSLEHPNENAMRPNTGKIMNIENTQ